VLAVAGLKWTIQNSAKTKVALEKIIM